MFGQSSMNGIVSNLSPTSKNVFFMEKNITKDNFLQFHPNYLFSKMFHLKANFCISLPTWRFILV